MSELTKFFSFDLQRFADTTQLKWGTADGVETATLLQSTDGGTTWKAVTKGFVKNNSADSGATANAYILTKGTYELAENITALDASLGFVGGESTLNLNGHNITTANTASTAIRIGEQGTVTGIESTPETGCGGLTISGKGTITSSADEGWGITLWPKTAGTVAKLTVGEGVTITADDIAISGNGSTDLKGTTEITINDGATITATATPTSITSTGIQSTGIYMPGDGKLTINGGTISGVGSGIEIRSGTLTVAGGTISSTDEYSVGVNGNKNSGGSTTGAAIAISQHNSKQAITATISGGTTSGKVGLSIANPYENDKTAETVSVTVDKSATGISGTESAIVVAGSGAVSALTAKGVVQLAAGKFTYTKTKSEDTSTFSIPAGEVKIGNGDAAVEYTVVGDDVKGVGNGTGDLQGIVLPKANDSISSATDGAFKGLAIYSAEDTELKGFTIPTDGGAMTITCIKDAETYSATGKGVTGEVGTNITLAQDSGNKSGVIFTPTAITGAVLGGANASIAYATGATFPEGFKIYSDATTTVDFAVVDLSKLKGKTGTISYDGTNYALSGTGLTTEGLFTDYTIALGTDSTAQVLFTKDAVTGFKFGAAEDSITGDLSDLTIYNSSNEAIESLPVTLPESGKLTCVEVDKSFSLTLPKGESKLTDTLTLNATTDTAAVTFSTSEITGITLGAKDSITTTGATTLTINGQSLDLSEIKGTVTITYDGTNYALSGAGLNGATIGGYKIVSGGSATLTLDSSGSVVGFKFGGEGDAITADDETDFSKVTLKGSDDTEVKFESTGLGAGGSVTATADGYALKGDNIDPVTLSENIDEVSDEFSGSVVVDKSGAVTGVAFTDNDAVTGDFSKLDIYVENSKGELVSVPKENQLTFTGKGKLAVDGKTTGSTVTFAYSPEAGSSIAFGKSSKPTAISVPNNQNGDTVYFTYNNKEAEEVVKSVDVEPNNETYTITAGTTGKETINITAVNSTTAESSKTNKITLNFSDNDTLKDITIGKDVTAATLTMGGSDILGEDVTIKKGTSGGKVNIDLDKSDKTGSYIYKVVDSEHIIDLATNTGEVEVASAGVATKLLPSKTAKIINIAGTEYNYVLGTAGNDGTGYFTLSSSKVTGFVFMNEKDSLTFDGSIPSGLTFYDGSTKSSDKLVLPTVSGSGVVSITKTGTDAFSMIVGSGVIVTDKAGVKIDFSGMNEADFATVVFDDKGNVSNVYSATANPLDSTKTLNGFTEGEIKVTGDKATKADEGLIFGNTTTAGTKAIDVASGSYTYAIDANATPYIKLDTATDTVYTTGDVAKVALAGTAGTITYGKSEKDAFIYANTSGDAYFMADSGAINGFVFGGDNDAITLPKGNSVDVAKFTLKYLNADEAETPINYLPTVSEYPYKVTMLDNATDTLEFQISEIPAKGVVNDGSNDLFTFDKTAAGANSINFNGTEVTALNIEKGKVTLETNAAALLNGTSDDSSDDWFKLNGKGVNIKASAALKYDADNKALHGLVDKDEVVAAGEITKVYVGATSAEITFGDPDTEGAQKEFTVTANTADTVSFTIEADSNGFAQVKGFTFAKIDDALTGNFTGLTLYDGETDTTGFAAPTIVDIEGAAVDTATITKTTATVNGTKKTECYSISVSDDGDKVTFGDKTEVTFDTFDTTPQVYFNKTGALLQITGLTAEEDKITVKNATGAVYIDKATVEITGGSFVYEMEANPNGTTPVAAIKELTDGVTVKQSGGIGQLWTAAGTSGNGTFTFGKTPFEIAGVTATDTDGTMFKWDAEKQVATGISSISDTESIKGALNGLTFGTVTEALAITGGNSTTYTLFGGGLSLAGLKSGEAVTATGGISNFITAEAGKFTILTTGMSIADDTEVAFKVASGALAGIDSLKGSAIGDFSTALAVNGLSSVQVTGDSSVAVVGDDKTVTAINQLGVTDAATAINVSASGVTNFGVDLNGKFDFNGAASFGVAGNGTEVTVFNLGTSAITGVDATETLSGNFENAFTVNGNALQVAGDSSISVVGGTQILGLTDGASVSKADNFTSATTDGLGTFKFAGGQSFTVSGTNKDGVVFQLDGKGKVVGISGVDEGEIVTGDLNGVVIKESGVAISVVGSDGKANTSLTYANGTLSGIVDGDTIYLADSATKVITAGGSVTFKAPDGDQAFWTDDTALTFDVKSDAKGVTATAVSELDAGKKLEGAIAGLSVNTKLVDITNDKDFGVIGAAAGVSAIYKLSDGAIVTDAAGATLASTDKFGTFTFQTSGQSFVTAGDSTVDFTLKDNAVTAIAGLSDGNVIGNFDVLTGVNGQTFEVKNDSEIQVFADDKGALSKIALVSGGASIGEIGSVSQILTDKAGEFAFTVGGQSFTTEGDNNVTFGMSASKVTSISELAGSVTGNFTGIKVNGATIDIIGDDEITVIGNGKALDEIQGVDADATINAAGGVADLVANISASSGKFTFKDSGEFVIAGDSSVTFVLNASASAQVTGIENFGDGVAATVTGGLSQVSVNGNSMSVAGDANNVFSYMVDAAGQATLGGVGGEKVTVSGVGGANFVQVTTEGDYNFFGTAYGLSLASGESSVLFGTDGKQVTSVADLEGTLKGDFSAAGFTVNGKEFEIAGDSSVGIVGSGSGVTKIVDLSGGANVKGVGGASVAITDSEGKFTFTNGSFSIAGDADGVTFMLEGDSVVGIKDLNEGATLTGSLDKLNSINGAKLDIKDDNNFGVVGATSGISKVVDLSTPANVVNAGGASQAVADTGETFTFPNGTFTVSGDSAATFDLNTDSEVTNIGVKAGATVSGPLNGIAINGGASLNVVGDTVFGAVAGDSKLAQLINLSGGANVSEAGGASQFVTDQAGEFTILGTAMEIGGDDNVMFTAGTSGITAIDSLEGTAFGDFSNGIAVNANDVKVLGDSSIEVTSDGSAVTAIASVTGSDAPTIAAVGGATEIGTDAAGTFTFTTGSASQAFTVGDDDEVTFTLEDGVVTGVNALEDGTLGFKDVNDLTVNETELTIESTQNVSLSIADSAVVYVQGVDGEIGGLENATVAATTAMTVNGTDINVQGDDDYKVVVQDGAVVGLTDVSAGATVNVAGVSIAVNESGDFQIGGNTYTFTDENNAFTLTTGDDSQLSGVDELQGNVVIAAPSTQSLAVNGDGIAFASNAEVVTVAAGASGITGVNGLVNKDGVSGDLTDAQIVMGSSSASVSTDGGALTVNDVTYTLLNDDNGITVTGGRVVTDLNENASLFVSEKGKYTVNGNTSDIEVEDTALPIIGLENASDAYIYDPEHILVGPNTPVEEIEKKLGLTTEYNDALGSAGAPLDTAGLSTALAQDLDKPLEIFATNDTKEPQDINLAGTDFSKKVHLFDGPQSVEFNNFGANEAIIERENPDGSATGGEKDITLGDGGDAVIMKADAGNGSAVDVTGGAGDDSVVVLGSAPVNFDMSEGGDDKIVTSAKTNARITLAGYDALTNPNAGIEISERWSSLAAAIVSGLLSFGDGLLNINNTSGDSAKIAFAGHTDPIGAVLVNLFDYLGQKLAVAFTNSGGGLADFSAAVEPMLLIGNNDGNKSGGSTLLGGSGDDTAIAGGGDEIDLGLGNNEIVLDPSTTREGAGIGLTRGRTKISGFNGTFNLDHGDVIATDLSSANISFRDGNVYIEGDGFYGVIAGAKPDGAISYDDALTESADATDPLTTTSGDYTNVLFNNAGVLVKTAIAKEGGVMDVKLDQDQRALNYIGDNSGLTFYDHTGEVFVNLADGTGSIDTADALFSGINSVAAGAGQTTIIGADDNETLIAGTGNDSIWAAGGDNLMRGNTGTDKTGQTSFFVVAEKDGARNTIEGFNFVTDDNYTNTNKITADKLDIQIQYDQIQTENGGVAISGNDVVLLVNNRSENKVESVIIKDAVGKDFIVSGDGIIKDVIAQVNVDKLTANKFANYFVATGKNATLTVSDEFDKANIYLDNETPLGSDHEDEIPQFYGDFKVIDATGSNAKLELGGNELDNTILAGTGDASLWGGNGGNDLLVAGLGKNSFFYNYGNGNDTIRGAKEGDVIDLTNILLDDIVDADSAIGDDGVKLQFTDGGSLTVEGTAGEYLIGDDTYVVEDGKWSKKA